MGTIDQIITARWVIPMGPKAQFIDHGAIAIDQGKIVAVGTEADITKAYQAREMIQRPTHVLMPGFVNCHTHMAMSLLRGIADDLPLMDWLQDHIWPAESASVSPDFVRDGVALALAELIKGGVTCVNDMYFYACDAADVVNQAGIRGRVADSILNISMPWAKSVEECYANTEKVAEYVKQFDLVDTCVAPHAPYTCDETILKRAHEIARKFDVPIHMHVQETFYELEQHRLMYNDERPMETLDRIGALADQFIAVHMTQVSQEDIDLLLKNNASTVHCPESNMKLSSGAAPVSTLLENGVNVALGTDGAASNNNLDMFGEMRSAAFKAKLVDESPTSLNAYQLLQMATINGAKALGYGDVTGSLEVGKSADLIAIDLNDVATMPVYNPVSQVVYAAHPHQVTDTWVAGKTVMQDRVLNTLDEKAILAKAQVWRDKIKG